MTSFLGGVHDLPTIDNAGGAWSRSRHHHRPDTAITTVGVAGTQADLELHRCSATTALPFTVPASRSCRAARSGPEQAATWRPRAGQTFALAAALAFTRHGRIRTGSTADVVREQLVGDVAGPRWLADLSAFGHFGQRDGHMSCMNSEQLPIGNRHILPGHGELRGRTRNEAMGGPEAPPSRRRRSRTDRRHSDKPRVSTVRQVQSVE